MISLISDGGVSKGPGGLLGIILRETDLRTSVNPSSWRGRSLIRPSSGQRLIVSRLVGALPTRFNHPSPGGKAGTDLSRHRSAFTGCRSLLRSPDEPLTGTEPGELGGERPKREPIEVELDDPEPELSAGDGARPFNKEVIIADRPSSGCPEVTGLTAIGATEDRPTTDV